MFTHFYTLPPPPLQNLLMIMTFFRRCKNDGSNPKIRSCANVGFHPFSLPAPNPLPKLTIYNETCLGDVKMTVLTLKLKIVQMLVSDFFHTLPNPLPKLTNYNDTFLGDVKMTVLTQELGVVQMLAFTHINTLPSPNLLNMMQFHSKYRRSTLFTKLLYQFRNVLFQLLKTKCLTYLLRGVKTAVLHQILGVY